MAYFQYEIINAIALSDTLGTMEVTPLATLTVTLRLE